MTNGVNYYVQSSSQPAKASVVAHGIPSESTCLVRKNLRMEEEKSLESALAQEQKLRNFSATCPLLFGF